MRELLEAPIEVTHRLVDASNATLLGEIEGVGKVIYKPIAGERPLWDFPSGTLADREVASFKVSEFLSLNLVPTTVMRDGPFGPGMVQLWVDVDKEVNIVEFGQSRNEQLRLLALFDAIINNTDRKFGHLLVDEDGHLFGCDHGVTFHSDDKLRTVLWQFSGEELTSSENELLEVLNRNSEEMNEILRPHLTVEEIDAFFRRVRTLSDEGRLPQPSESWPAVPWPPV
jgi:hypothetical protein